jgi:hypothetical protein
MTKREELTRLGIRYPGGSVLVDQRLVQSINLSYDERSFEKLVDLAEAIDGEIPAADAFILAEQKLERFRDSLGMLSYEFHKARFGRGQLAEQASFFFDADDALDFLLPTSDLEYSEIKDGLREFMEPRFETAFYKFVNDLDPKAMPLDFKPLVKWFKGLPAHEQGDAADPKNDRHLPEWLFTLASP